MGTAKFGGNLVQAREATYSSDARAKHAKKTHARMQASRGRRGLVLAWQASSKRCPGSRFGQADSKHYDAGRSISGVIPGQSSALDHKGNARFCSPSSDSQTSPGGRPLFGGLREALKVSFAFRKLRLHHRE